LDEGQQARDPLAGDAVLNRAAERAILASGVIAFFLAGYFGIGLHADPASARELWTPADRRIPFVAESIWIYLWLFPASLLPLFLIRCADLFRRTIAAYAIVIAVSLAVFAIDPVTSRELRVNAGSLDLTRISPWAVSLVYRLDPPYNLFPSLHLSVAALAALSAWKASRVYGAAVACGVLLIGVSICTVKQHFVLDGLGGVVLAAAAYAVVLRPYERPPRVDPAYGWRGPAAYAVLMALVYAGFVAAFMVRA
jgi:membrane-associated phospholipid phosphatase